MAKFSIHSFALKWHFFTFLSTINFYGEYFNLFMKQLGFNPAQIGFTTLMGLPNLLAPLYLLLGEKFRARKTVLIVAAVALSLCCVLPLLSLIVPPLQPKCYSKTSVNSFDATSEDATHQAVIKNALVHLKYANDANIFKRSIPSSKDVIRKPRSNLTTMLLRENLRLNNEDVSVHTNDALGQPSESKNNYSLHYLRTNVPRLTNTSSHLNDPTYFSEVHHPQPWISALFITLMLSRSQLVLLESIDIALANVATMTYLKEEKASYGAYYMWSHLGTALSICFIAGLAWFVKIPVCEVEKSGYFMAFIWGFVITLLSMLSLPWFKFEYNEKKSFNWSGVKNDVFNAHYIFMFIVLFCTSLCLSFQIYWEFWYLDGLSAGPFLLGGAALIRRPLVALSTFGSTYLIKKIGDLNTICFALLLYSLSFLALSFTRIAWLVLIIDTLQAVADGISFCAFTVLFYNASSPENSSIISGLLVTVFAVGYESGSTLMGVLFHTLGTQVTLLIYSTSSAALLVILLLYVHFSKYDHGYQKLAQDSEKE